MATLQDRLELAKQGWFRQRVRMAAINAAVDVQGEALGDMSPAKYNKRQALAAKVIATAGDGTPDDDLKKMFAYVCANDTLTQTWADNNYEEGAIPDGDIQFTMNSVWDDCAGVTGTD